MIHSIQILPLLRVGAGACDELPAVLAQLHVRHPLIVTDPVMVEVGHCRRIEAICRDAGTGSECTRFTIITDDATDEKLKCRGTGFLPAAAIIDYEFTLTAPRRLTADTGIDALTHAAEARCALLLEGLEGLDERPNLPTPAGFGIEGSAWFAHLERMATQAEASGSRASNPRVRGNG